MIHILFKCVDLNIFFSLLSPKGGELVDLDPERNVLKLRLNQAKRILVHIKCNLYIFKT